MNEMDNIEQMLDAALEKVNTGGDKKSDENIRVNAVYEEETVAFHAQIETSVPEFSSENAGEEAGGRPEDNADSSEAEKAAESAGEEIVAAESVSAETGSEAAAPAESAGEGIVAAESVPAETVSEAAAPAESAGEEIVAAESAGEEIVAAESVSAETGSEAAAPAESAGEEILAAESVSAETGSEPAAPAESASGEIIPAGSGQAGKAEDEEDASSLSRERSRKVRVIGVRFRTAGKVYYFNPGDLPVRKGSYVIVETVRGVEYGRVAGFPMELDAARVKQPLREVIRIATPEDTEREKLNREKEKEAYRICQQKIREHGLDMKLIEAEYTFDNSKVLFYFTADGRVDFRNLVKDLAGIFRMRIELRQIGVRDETKILGGYGICGRPLCCHTWLSEFVPVSIKMAKEQNLSLNPGKISGVCGRLMCCLKNEADTYEELNRNLPRVGDEVQGNDGLSGLVESVNVLRQTVRILVEVDDEKEYHEYGVGDITVLRKRRRGARNRKDAGSAGKSMETGNHDGGRAGRRRTDGREQTGADRRQADNRLKTAADRRQTDNPAQTGADCRPADNRVQAGGGRGQSDGRGQSAERGEADSREGSRGRRDRRSDRNPDSRGRNRRERRDRNTFGRESGQNQRREGRENSGGRSAYRHSRGSASGPDTGNGFGEANGTGGSDGDE